MEFSARHFRSSCRIPWRAACSNRHGDGLIGHSKFAVRLPAPRPRGGAVSGNMGGAAGGGVVSHGEKSSGFHAESIGAQPAAAIGRTFSSKIRFAAMGRMGRAQSVHERGDGHLLTKFNRGHGLHRKLGIGVGRHPCRVTGVVRLRPLAFVEQCPSQHWPARLKRSGGGRREEATGTRSIRTQVRGRQACQVRREIIGKTAANSPTWRRMGQR